MEDMGNVPPRESATCGHPAAEQPGRTQTATAATSTPPATTRSSTSTRSSTRRVLQRATSTCRRLPRRPRSRRRRRRNLLVHHAEPVRRRPRLPVRRTAARRERTRRRRRLPDDVGAADHSLARVQDRTASSSSPSTSRTARSRRLGVLRRDARAEHAACPASPASAAAASARVLLSPLHPRRHRERRRRTTTTRCCLHRGHLRPAAPRLCLDDERNLRTRRVQQVTGISRRAFLAKGASAGVGLVAAGPLAALASAATAATAGDRPYPKLPPGTEQFEQIQHIVVLMMENHSFDNHLGGLSRKGVDGRIPGPAAPSTCQAGYRISQSWDASHQSWDNGRNDGFVTACGPESMYYYTEAQLPYLLRARVDVPRLRPLLRIGDGADVSEPPLPPRRVGIRAGRRSAAAAERSEP